MTSWGDWEYIETYCGCKIYQTGIYSDYVYGSPCITGYYWTKAAVIKRIKAGGYCNDTPPPEEEGKASITNINLPDELQAGEWITGYIDVKNIGTIEDNLRILITTEWDNKQYQGSASVPVGYALRIDIPEGLITMPEVDAIITIEGQHLEDGSWVTDDLKTH